MAEHLLNAYCLNFGATYRRKQNIAANLIYSFSCRLPKNALKFKLCIPSCDLLIKPNLNLPEVCDFFPSLSHNVWPIFPSDSEDLIIQCIKSIVFPPFLRSQHNDYHCMIPLDLSIEKSFLNYNSEQAISSLAALHIMPHFQADKLSGANRSIESNYFLNSRLIPQHRKMASFVL